MLRVFVSAEMVMISPSLTRAIGPPTAEC
jgi:hypothetical protein